MTTEVPTLLPASAKLPVTAPAGEGKAQPVSGAAPQQGVLSAILQSGPASMAQFSALLAGAGKKTFPIAAKPDAAQGSPLSSGREFATAQINGNSLPLVLNLPSTLLSHDPVSEQSAAPLVADASSTDETGEVPETLDPYIPIPAVIVPTITKQRSTLSTAALDNPPPSLNATAHPLPEGGRNILPLPRLVDPTSATFITEQDAGAGSEGFPAPLIDQTSITGTRLEAPVSTPPAAIAEFDLLVHGLNVRKGAPLRPLSDLAVGGDRGLLAAHVQASDNPADAVKWTASVPVAADDPQWGRAFGERVMWMVNQNIQSARVHLNPPELGPVELRVAVRSEQVSINVITHHAATRDLLENALPHLRDMLSQNGMNLASTQFSDRNAADGRNAAHDLAERHLAPAGKEPDVVGDDTPPLVSAVERTAIGLIDAYA